LEWIYRFLQEPGRLGPRYAKDLRRFGWAIGRQIRAVGADGSNQDSNEALTATFSMQVARITAPRRLGRSVLMRDLPRRFYLHAQDCVVDLSQTRSLDSTALGWLARLHRNQHDAGRKLILLAPRKSVRRLLSVTGLDQMLTIASNEAETAQLIATEQ
jgi:anti-anti-sigma factor